MALDRFLARCGSIGGTARFAANGFWSAVTAGVVTNRRVTSQQELDAAVEQVVQHALRVRFRGNSQHPNAQRIHQTWQMLGGGLEHFVEAVLAVEAGYLENSYETIAMFRGVIREELAKKNVEPAFVTGRFPMGSRGGHE